MTELIIGPSFPIEPAPTENVTYLNFQAFLQSLKGSLSAQSDENYLNTIENIKTPFFQIINPQDLEEITQLYLKIFPMSIPTGFFSNFP